MFRRCVALLMISSCLLSIETAVGAERPNVILIMADDMGYGDLGVHGNPLIRTPNLDELSRRSAGLTTFYVSPVCAPTRASLMTGRYNYRTRVVDTWVGRAMMDPTEVTIAELLSGAGYATGIFGKWHLGDCYPMRPMDQGFSMSLVHRGGGIGQPSDPPGGEGKYTDPILFRQGEAEQCQGYCTDVYYTNAMEFIEESTRDGKPFFVYLPDNCPHGPFDDVPEADYEAYRRVNLQNDQFPQEQGEALPNNNVDQRARIYAMVTNIDRNVGRLLDRLRKLRIDQNTIVIFMVDNGPNGNRYRAGLRGTKSHVHEGGVRSPFYVHWPARLKAGYRSEQLGAHIDVLPTLLDACEVVVPESLKLDGISLLPALEGQQTDPIERTIVIQSHRGDEPQKFHNFMLRTTRWKLVHPSGFGRESFSGQPRLELFDMQADPLEMQNVAGAHPDIVRDLTARYSQWFADVSSTRPDNYAPPRIVIGTEHEQVTDLSRQDWRHRHGRPWAADSRGVWLLDNQHTQPGDNWLVEVRFDPARQASRVEIRVNGKVSSVDVEPGQTSCHIHGLRMPRGECELEAVVVEGPLERGAFQVTLQLEQSS